MSQQFTEIIKDAIINPTMESKDYKCPILWQRVPKESTLAAHPCEPKTSAQQQHESGPN